MFSFEAWPSLALSTHIEDPIQKDDANEAEKRPPDADAKGKVDNGGDGGRGNEAVEAPALPSKKCDRKDDVRDGAKNDDADTDRRWLQTRLSHPGDGQRGDDRCRSVGNDHERKPSRQTAVTLGWLLGW